MNYCIIFSDSKLFLGGELKLGNKLIFREKLVRYNIKINIFNGIAAIIATNLVNPYFVKFAERIGASDYQIAYLSSLPALISVFALIPGGILIDNFKDKKKITGSIIFCHKLFYLFLAFVPFFNKNYQPWIFVLLVGFMNLPGSISIIGFQSSIGDVFNIRDRGRAMGLRNKYSTIFGMLVAFVSGQLLTRIPNTNGETIVLYQIFFIIAFLIAQMEVFSYFKLRGIKSAKRVTGTSYWESLKHILHKDNLLKQKPFLIFTGCSLLFHFGWQMGWPLFNLYAVKYLEANEIWLSAITIASSISSFLAYPIWAKLADRKGNSMMLSIATFGMAITPILYAISGNLLSLVLFNIIIGISVSGTVLILFNILLEVVPDKNRTIYIALYNTLINISATFSPIIGVAIKDKFTIYVALIVVGCLRMIGSIAFFIRNKVVNNGN
ncbi:MAG: MFS transporter [Firmicutes bacterium]|nr:MFS transporter [Bacillota bacterium]